MSVGGIGVISVLSNIMPSEVYGITLHCLNDYFKSAMQDQLKYEKLIRALFIEVNPIPVKEALCLMGYNVGRCRLPLDKMSAKHRQFLKECMEELHLI